MKTIHDKKVTDKIGYIQDTLYTIGGKWKLPIIIAVYYGNRRFKDLKKCIPKITSRVLSKELKELEANKLIKRTVYDDLPVLVEYTFAEYAHTLEPVIGAMSKWGEQHRRTIKGK